jgi:SET domain-containing protein
MMQSDAIEIKRVRGKGRGVFARRRIRRGEVIERVPVLVLAAEEVRDAGSWTGLAGYCFEWDGGGRILAFTALRDIGPGEEVTVNYNGEPGDETPVGFEVVEHPTSTVMIGPVDGTG